jgi:hypothetical protein
MNKISSELVAQCDTKLNALGERMIKMSGMKIASIENLAATQVRQIIKLLTTHT